MVQKKHEYLKKKLNFLENYKDGWKFKGNFCLIEILTIFFIVIHSYFLLLAIVYQVLLSLLPFLLFFIRFFSLSFIALKVVFHLFIHLISILEGQPDLENDSDFFCEEIYIFLELWDEHNLFHICIQQFKVLI